MLGPQHTSTLSTASNLAALYAAQGKLAQAEQMYLWALTGYEKALQFETIPDMNNFRDLGLLYRDQNKRKGAKKMFRCAALGMEKVINDLIMLRLGEINYKPGR